MRVIKLLFILTQTSTLLCAGTDKKISAALKIATHVYKEYTILYAHCLSTPMSNQRFIVDNLHSYINAFSKTTVGYAPVFTGNRKFFANMINTAAFKNMLSKDIATLQNNFLEKMRLCDNSVMDQENLRQFYDREVDQTKL